MEIRCCFWKGFTQCLALCRGSHHELVILLWEPFDVTSYPLHLSGGHVLKEVPTGLLSDVFCPGDFCSPETGMYFRKDLIWG